MTDVNEEMKRALEDIFRHADRPGVAAMEACRYCQGVAKRALAAAQAGEAQETWRPMREAQLHVKVLAGLWVLDNRKGETVWDTYLGSVNDQGDFVDENGEGFGWDLEDFVGFRPLPQPPKGV